MTSASPDLTGTLFLLPPDATFVPVSELSPRLRERIGPVEGGQAVITRPGRRITARLVPAPLADLISEFRSPSLVTDAVVRFARAHDQDPGAILDMAFDALATLIEVRILVPDGSLDGAAPVPSLSAGQAFAGLEIEALVRSLDDSEVYRARRFDGSPVALKVGRDDRPGVGDMLANEARMLDHLAGVASPRLLDHGIDGDRRYVAMEWCEGVSIAVAAQQLRAARDRRGLHDLVCRMLDAYARLHEQGVLHGDIHPGNCLVGDDGRVVLLDFGNARPVGPVGGAMDAVDSSRTGIPQFYDPQVAGDLLDGRLPRPATPASEQYSIAVLAYLLLTGLLPIAAVAVQDELLRRIAERAPLPFSTRGVAAWPSAEAVVRRALARQPGERFSDVREFARALASAEVPSDVRTRPPEAARRAFEAAVMAVRSIAPSAEPRELAWFGLRSALALDDAELLAAADILVRRAGPGWAAQAVAAHVARARSDARMLDASITGFLLAADRVTSGPQSSAALLAAVGLLHGTATGSEGGASLAGWVRDRLDRHGQSRSAADPTIPESVSLIGVLSLCASGTIAVPADLVGRLEAPRVPRSDEVWLWALAHDVLADDRFRALALSSELPSRPLGRAFALLRLHQLTGELSWVAEATRIVVTAPRSRLRDLDRALLVAELMAPEQAILPPFATQAAATG